MLYGWHGGGGGGGVGAWIWMALAMLIFWRGICALSEFVFRRPGTRHYLVTVLLPGRDAERIYLAVPEANRGGNL